MKNIKGFIWGTLLLYGSSFLSAFVIDANFWGATFLAYLFIAVAGWGGWSTYFAWDEDKLGKGYFIVIGMYYFTYMAIMQFLGIWKILQNS
jgi:hypothetical protein